MLYYINPHSQIGFKTSGHFNLSPCLHVKLYFVIAGLFLYQCTVRVSIYIWTCLPDTPILQKKAYTIGMGGVFWR